MAYYQSNRLSIKSSTTTANILAQMLLLNQSIESFREALAQTPYFDALGLFRFLDKQEKGYLCEKDLLKVIGTSHRKLLTYAFSWVDNLKEGEISRLEFSAFLLPRDNLELRETVAERIQHPELAFSQAQTIFQQFDIFRQMILQIMRREMKLIELRRALINSSDYSLRGVIMAIDSSRHDWVCAEDIFKFMKNYGFDVTLRQVEKLVEVINYRTDGKVTEEQLKWTVQGLQGQDKSYLQKIKFTNKKKPPQKPQNIDQSFAQHIKQKQNEQIILNNPAEGVYRQLLQKKKLIEVEEKLIDRGLLEKQKIALQNNRSECQRERIALQLKKQMDVQIRLRERQEWLARKEMEKQIQSMLLRTSQIEAESQRLVRLEKKIARQQDANSIRQTYLQLPKTDISSFEAKFKQNYSNYRPPSFGFQSLLPFQNPSLNILRESRSQAIKAHLDSSQTYLQATRQLREKIRREREIQKSIHNQFLSTPGTKYGSYFTNRQNKEREVRPLIPRIPGQIKDISKSGVKENELGLISNQKRIESNELNMLQSNELKPTDLGPHFETPDQRIIGESSNVTKMQVPTTNKQE